MLDILSNGTSSPCESISRPLSPSSVPTSSVPIHLFFVASLFISPIRRAALALNSPFVEVFTLHLHLSRLLTDLQPLVFSVLIHSFLTHSPETKYWLLVNHTFVESIHLLQISRQSVCIQGTSRPLLTWGAHGSRPQSGSNQTNQMERLYTGVRLGFYWVGIILILEANSSWLIIFSNPLSYHINVYIFIYIHTHIYVPKHKSTSREERKKLEICQEISPRRETS